MEFSSGLLSARFRRDPPVFCAGTGISNGPGALARPCFVHALRWILRPAVSENVVPVLPALGAQPFVSSVPPLEAAGAEVSGPVGVVSADDALGLPLRDPGRELGGGGGGQLDDGTGRRPAQPSDRLAGGAPSAWTTRSMAPPRLRTWSKYLIPSTAATEPSHRQSFGSRSSESLRHPSRGATRSSGSSRSRSRSSGTGRTGGAVAARSSRGSFAAGAALPPRFLGEELVELEKDAQYFGGNKKCQVLAENLPGNVQDSAFSLFC